MISGSTRLIHVTTVPMSLIFLRGQVGFMKARGFDVTVVSSPGAELSCFAAAEGVDAVAVPMTRRITPFRDLLAVVRLWWLFRRTQPAIVHAHTPKGGLLGMIAAWLARVPARVYHMHGLPLMTAEGGRRLLLKAAERLSCTLAHRVICVSASLRDDAIAEGLCEPACATVLAGGSGNGVDADGRFDVANVTPRLRAQTRAALGLPADAAVVGFVGRVTRDKGIPELAAAWKTVRSAHPAARLLLVGPLELEGAPAPRDARAFLEEDPRVAQIGQVADVLPYYAAMDVVALPTRREGLPNVLLEAGALELPVVATRVTGCVDAVVDGETGTLVPPGDSASLATALNRYLADPELRRRHGSAARRRVRAGFRRAAIWEALADEYARLLSRRAKPALRPGQLAKAVVDCAVAAALLLLLLPLLGVIALLILAAEGAPVFFRQPRPGLHGRPFTLLKFRTMRQACDSAGRPLPDADRLTRIGSFLRRTSLDELPQLWNVLRGDMSLVGPRPLLMQYLERYTPGQARRHEVKPGITGWAQVNGRNGISWDEKFAHDVWYVDNWSLWLDLKILALTVWKVMRGGGISASGEATMPEFMGSKTAPVKSMELVA